MWLIKGFIFDVLSDAVEFTYFLEDAVDTGREWLLSLSELVDETRKDD